ATPQPTLKPTPTEIKKGGTVTFTIVYDNNAYDPALQTDWGFACWVETGEATLLFDTGGNGATLLSNMATLGLDPREIDAVVLSHTHGDHTGGLAGLLDTGVRPTVYVPSAFPASFKDGVRARTELVEVTGPMEILPGFHTTGEMGAGTIEQALVVETEAGADKRHPLVVVTGCAHPGVEKLARRAKESVGGEIYLVMGGFHLGGASRSRVENIIADFRDLGVQRVAPCHCTGDVARQMFADAFGDAYVPAGVGRVIILGAGGVE
ncbi:MAG: MBL fold metallo-hydrolase, partial [Chloroflexota bacterium]|nr:MBL fold metallo-hydrolase [Chloroflexota bacterium]